MNFNIGSMLFETVVFAIDGSSSFCSSSYKILILRGVGVAEAILTVFLARVQVLRRALRLLKSKA